MRRKTLGLLLVVAVPLVMALPLAGCTPARTSTAPSKTPTYACSTLISGQTAACMQFSNVAGGAAGVVRLKHGCLVVPGRSFGSTCSADGLVGCCTMRQPDGVRAETCFYKEGPLVGRPGQCAKDGGVWSAAP